jgi:two-component system sensor histidine kinase MtrB
MGQPATVAQVTPRRFRRRLTSAFIVVAALSAGLVATLAVLLAREYRWRSFREQSLEEARVAMALAPRKLDEAAFERVRAEYEARTDADLVAATGDVVFSSSADIDAEDVPEDLTEVAPGDLRSTRELIDGRRFLIAGTADDDNRYWFFFSLRQLEDSISDFTRVCAAAWVLTTAIAGLVGRAVATRVLLPVRALAVAAEAIAEGAEAARLPEADDEFGAVARSFNVMADEVQQRIRDLERSAVREQRFTADIAHDLRTPLTGMAASASLLADRAADLPDTLQRPAQLLAGDVERLRQLVLELLELHRLDAGADPVLAVPLHMGEAVAASARSLGSSSLLNLSIDAGEDDLVLAEPRRLGRILANLLANAATHGGGTARVRTTRSDGSMVTEIADDGPGIPTEELEVIFDRFSKYDRARGGAGSGLGLAIARGHAIAQGGDLVARNQPGGGACFELTLPAAAPAPPS